MSGLRSLHADTNKPKIGDPGPGPLWAEFRSYATRGGQVFVSTHSPDFLNAVEISEAFWLVKEKGYTEVRRAQDDKQIVAYMNEGDKLGFLWKEGLFAGADPR